METENKLKCFIQRRNCKPFDPDFEQVPHHRYGTMPVSMAFRTDISVIGSEQVLPSVRYASATMLMSHHASRSFTITQSFRECSWAVDVMFPPVNDETDLFISLDGQ